MHHMKKFGKFVFGTLSVATIAAGAYYLYKNYIKEDASDDFDDFEDDYEDFDTELEEEDDKVNETREYVSINITTDEKEEAPEETEASLDNTDEEERPEADQ